MQTTTDISSIKLNPIHLLTLAAMARTVRPMRSYKETQLLNEGLSRIKRSVAVALLNRGLIREATGGKFRHYSIMPLGYEVVWTRLRANSMPMREALTYKAWMVTDSISNNRPFNPYCPAKTYPNMYLTDAKIWVWWDTSFSKQGWVAQAKGWSDLVAIDSVPEFGMFLKCVGASKPGLL